MTSPEIPPDLRVCIQIQFKSCFSIVSLLRAMDQVINVWWGFMIVINLMTVIKAWSNIFFSVVMWARASDNSAEYWSKSPVSQGYTKPYFLMLRWNQICSISIEDICLESAENCLTVNNLYVICNWRRKWHLHFIGFAILYARCRTMNSECNIYKNNCAALFLKI